MVKIGNSSLKCLELKMVNKSEKDTLTNSTLESRGKIGLKNKTKRYLSFTVKSGASGLK